MSEPTRGLVGDILRACADAAPRPWLPPPDFLRGRGETPDDLEYCIDALLRARAIRLAADDRGNLVGLLLGERGAEPANDPQALERLIADEALDFSKPDTPQWREVRRVLRSPYRPRIRRLLLGLNVLVFAVGFLLASRQQAAGDFLMPFTLRGGQVAGGNNPAVFDALVRTGLLRRDDVPRGDWWRLLSCGFVHIGVIHLLMNMYALRVLGGDSEWLWGPRRFLVIYLLSLLGGSCAALTTAQAVGGASGALCGLLAAVGVWMLLHRRYLPRRLVRSQTQALIVNGLLIGLISMASMVSGAGHLGGAVVGAAAALLLHLHRFGPPLLSRLAVVGLFAVAAGCLYGAKRVTEPQPLPAPAHSARTTAELKAHLQTVYSRGLRFHHQTLRPLIDTRVERRDPDLLRKALDGLPRLIRENQDEAWELSRPPAEGESDETLRKVGRDYFSAFAARLTRIERCLKEAKEWNQAVDEDDDLGKTQQEFRKRIDAR
jgi:membrane associated rhomboid family serine protease